MKDFTSDEVELELRTVPDSLTTPLPIECLLCFVWRMLDAFGCNATLRWARLWRDARAVRATSLEHRLGQRGAFCDCEIFLNGWVAAAMLQPTDSDQAVPSARLVTCCAGIRRGSSQPCGVWVRRPRPWPRL